MADDVMRFFNFLLHLINICPLLGSQRSSAKTYYRTVFFLGNGNSFIL